MSELNKTIDDPHQDEERAIRDEIDHWIQSTSAGGIGNCKLHIPKEDKPLCFHQRSDQPHGPVGQSADEYTTKDLAVMPFGYRDICLYCTQLWRDGEL